MVTFDPSKQTAAELLQRLKEAHAEVRRCVTDLENLTSKSECTKLEYTTARFRISRASLARRNLFNAICHELNKRATDADASVLGKLTAMDKRLLGKSRQHVETWTTERISSDWLSYCAASKLIRLEMLKELRAEEELLFPLLQRRSIKSISNRVSKAA